MGFVIERTTFPFSSYQYPSLNHPHTFEQQPFGDDVAAFTEVIAGKILHRFLSLINRPIVFAYVFAGHSMELIKTLLVGQQFPFAVKSSEPT